MSRRPSSKLPNVPQTDPEIETIKKALPNVPQTDPEIETLKSMPDQYSTQWFALYDGMSKTNKAKYNHYLLKRLNERDPGWTYQGVIKTFLESKRKEAERKEEERKEQAERLKTLKETLSQFKPPPTKQPVSKSEPKSTRVTAFTVPPDVYKQCQQLSKEIDGLLGYTKGVEKFPEIDRKYRRNFFEELEKLRNQLSNECFLRGQVPERQKFFKKMNTLLENMMAEMLADPRYEAIRQARQGAQGAQGAQGRQGGKRRTRKHKRKAKGKTRKYHRKKHRKRKTRKSTN